MARAECSRQRRRPPHSDGSTKDDERREGLPKARLGGYGRAIDSAIAGDSRYPARASFLNADAPWLGDAIARAADEDRAVVLCYADGTRRVLIQR